jgi:hypothetical protein
LEERRRHNLQIMGRTEECRKARIFVQRMHGTRGLGQVE